MDSPKSLLVQEVLEKCVRLSYYERVSQGFATDPSGVGNMTVLMPPQPRPSFKYDSYEKAFKRAENERASANVARKDIEVDVMVESGAIAQDPRAIAFADRFLEGLRLKQPLKELQSVLKDVAAYGATLGMDTAESEQTPGMALARDIAVQCILFIGSKSFSHMLNIMERQMALLKWLAPTPEAKLHVLQIVAEFWQNNKQVRLFIFFKSHLSY
jgi:nuclear cap-binding protein subunit 1